MSTAVKRPKNGLVKKEDSLVIKEQKQILVVSETQQKNIVSQDLTDFEKAEKLIEKISLENGGQAIKYDNNIYFKDVSGLGFIIKYENSLYLNKFSNDQAFTKYFKTSGGVVDMKLLEDLKKDLELKTKKNVDIVKKFVGRDLLVFLLGKGGFANKLTDKECQKLTGLKNCNYENLKINGINISKLLKKDKRENTLNLRKQSILNNININDLLS